MLYTPENCKGKILVDCRGTPIPSAYSFDDETNEAVIYLMGKTENGHTKTVMIPVTDKEPAWNWEPVRFTVILPGAKMIDRPKRNNTGDGEESREL